MARLKRVTCLSYLKNGHASKDNEDEEDQLTLQETLCEDSDAEGHEIETETPVTGFLRSSYGTGTLYTLLLIVVAGSLIALVAVVTHVLLPFLLVHGFRNGTCTPWELVVEEGKTCMCGVGCTAQYRCLVIRVVFQDAGGRWTNATVFEDEAALGKECSFYPPCHTSLGLISDSVREYETKYGTIGRSFTCFHGDRHLGHVIRTRKFGIADIAHGLFWSAAIFVVSAVALVITLRKHTCT